jgi:LmeA-like phospholipid-binding
MRRGVRILIVVVVVLGGLFVAADRLAVSYAQGRVAQRIQSSQGLSAEPDVSIKGFPFLTQVAGRDLDEVTVTADDVEASGASGTDQGRLRIAHLAADLHDIKLSGDYHSAVARTATGSALVSYADLSSGAPAGVTVSYGGRDSAGQGQVKVTGSIVLPALGAIHRSVVSELSVTGGDTVRLHAKAIPGGSTIPGLDHLVREKIDFARQLSGLPAGISLRSVRATPSGIEIALTGSDVSLTH